SIPRASRLDRLDEKKRVREIAATLDIPEDVSSRISFGIEIGPKPQTPQTFGVALNYELYSAVVRAIETPLALPPEMSDHFIAGMLNFGLFDKRQIGKANAELAFHKAAHSNAPPIFREEGGAYVVLSAVPMRVAPKLEIDFNRDGLFVK